MQDLEALSSGLEGRSSNSIAILLDALLRPDTDVGGVYPSSLVWSYDPQRAVSHVIIGRGLPGGSWQHMEPNLKTLSLGSWLDLPMYSFADWTDEHQHKEEPSSDFDEMAQTDVKTGRVLVGDIAHYYADYVIKMGLAENFVDYTEVEQVMSLDRTSMQLCSKERRSRSSSSCSSTLSQTSLNSPLRSRSASFSPDTSSFLMKTEWEYLSNICSVIVDSHDRDVQCPGDVKCTTGRNLAPKWYLRGSQKFGGQDVIGEKKVCVFSEKLVLACGVSGHVRWLGVPGEHAQFVTHDVPEFIACVNSYQQQDGTEGVGTLLPMVVIVGAGLSAADAILRALGKGFQVIHVFRQNPNDQHLVFDRIPQRTYPGYSHLYELMKGKATDNNYICRSQAHVLDFGEDDQSISILNNVGEKETWASVSFGGVFIGTDVELGFLPDSVTAQLGTDPLAPINAKHNPVDVDQISFVSEAVPSLYAIGSLTGDNFVRFGIGSALGAAQHILGLNFS